jgi:uncharacterized phage infection (PIP) family protein YhgE
MLLRIRASRDSDIERIRLLQDEYNDTLRIAQDLQDGIGQIDAQIQQLEEARDEAEDELRDNMDQLERIDRELAQFPQELIDEAFDG